MSATVRFGKSIAALVCVFLLALLLPEFLPARGTAVPARSSRSARSEQAAGAAEAAANAAGDSARPITAYTLPPAKERAAAAYERAEDGLYFGGTAYGLGVLLLVLAWRLGPRYRQWAERATRARPGQAAIYVPLLFFTIAALVLPIDVASQAVERHFGLSVEGWGPWAWDWTKSQFITCVAGVFLVSILYGVIRRRRQRWWFYFWAAALPILFFIVFISPFVLDPMFNKFEPLARSDPALVAELERVCAHGGVSIPPSRMYLMEASRKVNALNAYVTGFGASKRVVVWDTTIAKMTGPEIAFTFGHEMGHYVLHHIVKGMAIGALGLLAVFWLVFRAFEWSLGRWGARAGIGAAGDWASLPLLWLWLSVFLFLGTPLANAVSRHFEHEADRYGLEITHGVVADSSENAARAFQVFGENDLAAVHPNPFVVFWLYSHPPIAERVQFALHYDPWGRGEQPRYVR